MKRAGSIFRSDQKASYFLHFLGFQSRSSLLWKAFGFSAEPEKIFKVILMAKNCSEKTFFATYTRVYLSQIGLDRTNLHFEAGYQVSANVKTKILLWKDFWRMFFFSLVRCRCEIAAMRSLNSASKGKRSSAEQASKLLVQCAETVLLMTQC